MTLLIVDRKRFSEMRYLQTVLGDAWRVIVPLSNIRGIVYSKAVFVKGWENDYPTQVVCEWLIEMKQRQRGRAEPSVI